MRRIDCFLLLGDAPHAAQIDERPEDEPELRLVLRSHSDESDRGARTTWRVETQVRGAFGRAVFQEVNRQHTAQAALAALLDRNLDPPDSLLQAIVADPMVLHEVLQLFGGGAPSATRDRCFFRLLATIDEDDRPGVAGFLLRDAELIQRALASGYAEWLSDQFEVLGVLVDVALGQLGKPVFPTSWYDEIAGDRLFRELPALLGRQDAWLVVRRVGTILDKCAPADRGRLNRRLWELAPALVDPRPEDNGGNGGQWHQDHANILYGRPGMLSALGAEESPNSDNREYLTRSLADGSIARAILRQGATLVDRLRSGPANSADHRGWDRIAYVLETGSIPLQEAVLQACLASPGLARILRRTSRGGEDLLRCIEAIEDHAYEDLAPLFSKLERPVVRSLMSALPAGFRRLVAFACLDPYGDPASWVRGDNHSFIQKAQEHIGGDGDRTLAERQKGILLIAYRWGSPIDADDWPEVLALLATVAKQCESSWRGAWALTLDTLRHRDALFVQCVARPPDPSGEGFSCMSCLEELPAADRAQLVLSSPGGEDHCGGCMARYLASDTGWRIPGLPPVIVRDYENFGVRIGPSAGAAGRLLAEEVSGWVCCTDAECPGGAIVGDDTAYSMCLGCHARITTGDPSGLIDRALLMVGGLLGGTSRGTDIVRPCGHCGEAVAKDGECSSLAGGRNACPCCHKALGHWSQGPEGRGHHFFDWEPVQNYLPPPSYTGSDGETRPSRWLLHEIGLFADLPTGPAAWHTIAAVLDVRSAETQQMNGFVSIRPDCIEAVRARAADLVRAAVGRHLRASRGRP